jgi:hypothetical protein
MNATWMGPMSGMKDGMKPWADALTLGSSMMEQMTKARMDAMTEIFDSTMTHAKALGGTRDWAALGKAQADYLAELGRCVFELAQKDLDVIARAQAQLGSMMEGHARETVDKVRRGAAKVAEAG